MPYRYEELDDARFQQLCQSILIESHPNLRAFPVRQPDGGRDATASTELGESDLVFQVKWSRDPSGVSDPVEWLSHALQGEVEKIEGLAGQGLIEYRIITNVRGTAHLRSGRIDRFDQITGDLSRRLGIKITSWWRDDLDRRLDRCSDSVKFSYPEILVNLDAYRALFQSRVGTPRQDRIRRIVDLATRAFYDDDRDVKFKQADLEKATIESLFVDTPVGIDGQTVCELLVRPGPGLYLLEGAPGQGKSTSVQFLSQAFRAAHLSEHKFFEKAEIAVPTETPRVAIRIELKDYQVWLGGRDPHTKKAPPLAADVPRSVEGFVVRLLKRASGGLDVTVQDLHDLAESLPLFLAFDGLDEVSQRMRGEVIDQLRKSISRLEGTSANLVAVVTTRPTEDQQVDDLKRALRVYRMQPLSELTKDRYLTKWAKAMGISARERATLQGVFEKHRKRPHVASLTENPMQLTILLYLMWARTESIPDDRTSLYVEYMTRFLDRESKDDLVRKHRRVLERVTAYLGWHLHAADESTGTRGRIELNELRKLIVVYLHDNELPTEIVDELFTALRDRVWVLTSRVTGTFEFLVRPVQEFFAAKYLADTAPFNEREGGADKITRFLELVAREHWFNVVKFYCGFFTSGERSALAMAFGDACAQRPYSLTLRRTLRSLVWDGVFDPASRAERFAIESMLDPLGIRVLAGDLRSGRTTPFRSRQTADAVRLALEPVLQGNLPIAIVDDAATIFVEHSQTEQLLAWWQGVVSADTLSPGRLLRIARVLPVDEAEFTLSSSVVSTVELSKLALWAGIAPANSLMRSQMVDLILNAESPPAVRGTSEISRLARLLAPSLFSTKGAAYHELGKSPTELSRLDESARIASAEFPELADVLSELTEAPRRDKSTELWISVSAALHVANPQSWLAREIAIYGAALVNLKHVSASPRAGNEPAVPTSSWHPRKFISGIRDHRLHDSWWELQLASSADAIDIATWVVAYLVCRGEIPRARTLNLIEKALNRLDEGTMQQVLDATRRARRISESYRSISIRHLAGVGRAHPVFACLALQVSTHGGSRDARILYDQLDGLTGVLKVSLLRRLWRLRAVVRPGDLEEYMRYASELADLEADESIDVRIKSPSPNHVESLPSPVVLAMVSSIRPPFEPLEVHAAKEKWFLT